MAKRMIMGGTFNPIHNGHMKAAMELERLYEPDEMILIPTGTPPHKEIEDESVTGLNRLEMTKEAVKNLSHYTVLDVEINRRGKSYTVDTLRELKEKYALDELFLIMGSDMLETFEQWREFKEIFTLCTLIAASRDETSKDRLEEVANGFRKKYHAKIDVVDVDPVEVSSTQIRNMVMQGEDIKELVPSSVLDYIKNHQLYG